LAGGVCPTIVHPVPPMANFKYCAKFYFTSNIFCCTISIKLNIVILIHLKGGNPLGELPIMSIENATLAHFRHFRSLLTNKIRSTLSPIFSYAIRCTLSAIRDKTHYFVKKSHFFKHFGVLMVINLLFRWLLEKVVSMALWTKASLCGKSSLLEHRLPRTPSRPKTSVTSVISVAKNLFNQRNPMNWSLSAVALAKADPFVTKTPRNLRNPWLIKDLHACKVHYNCRDIITFVVSALQISPFLTNKPNFPKSQMNVTKVLTVDYAKRTLGQRGKNKANSKPNKANFKKAKIFVTAFQTKVYENMSNWVIFENKPNTKPNKPNLKTDY